VAAGATPSETQDSQADLPLTRKDLDQVKTELAAKADKDKAALSTELAAARDLARAAEERAKKAEEKKPDPPKTYARHELDAMVDAGTISTATRDDIWTRQQAASQKAEVASLIQAGIEQYKTQDLTEREMALYAKNYPDVFKEGDETRQRVQEAYNHLVRMGDPADDKRTELKALYAVLGPAEKIPEHTARRTPTHVESGGSGSGGSGSPGKSSDGVPKPLRDNPKLKFHYDALIADKTYSGYDDPALVKEMKYAEQRQKRLAAR